MAKNSSSDLVNMFFSDLKHYNTTNFKTIQRADLNVEDAVTYKSFSSVITRFFIFSERHPELSESDLKMLYFKLKIDMIARYFANYPANSADDLKPFQVELLQYIDNCKRRELCK